MDPRTAAQASWGSSLSHSHAQHPGLVYDVPVNWVCKSRDPAETKAGAVSLASASRSDPSDSSCIRAPLSCDYARRFPGFVHHVDVLVQLAEPPAEGRRVCGSPGSALSECDTGLSGSDTPEWPRRGDIGSLTQSEEDACIEKHRTKFRKLGGWSSRDLTGHNPKELSLYS